MGCISLKVIHLLLDVFIIEEILVEALRHEKRRATITPYS